VKKEEKEEKPVKKLMKQKEVLNEISDIDEDLYMENEKARCKLNHLIIEIVKT
jgi:hypothetical protein